MSKFVTANLICENIDVKRLNPENNKVFVRGDSRPSSDKQDDKVFFCYRPYVKKNGYQAERWVTKADLKILNKKKSIYRKKNEIKYNPKIHKKRINPLTGNFFKRGDIEKGKYFYQYSYIVSPSSGYCYEKWKTRKAYIQTCISKTNTRIKKTCSNSNIPYNINTKYLISIYPKDSLCPALGIEMSFSNENRNNFPSVDRIIPKKGYVQGNLIWVSYRANRIKTDATIKELNQLSKFYQNL